MIYNHFSNLCAKVYNFRKVVTAFCAFLSKNDENSYYCPVMTAKMTSI